MASSIRVFTKRFFLYANIVAVMFFLLACLVPYLHPQKWWIISILGLAFPFLLLVVLLFFAAWFILTRPRYAIVSGVALLLGLKSILVFFAFNAPRAFQYKRTPGTIRIVSWNVARFVELKRNNNAGSEKRKLMLELLKKQDADIRLPQGIFQLIGPVAGINEQNRHAGQSAAKLDGQIFRNVRRPDSGMLPWDDTRSGKGLCHC